MELGWYPLVDVSAIALPCSARNRHPVRRPHCSRSSSDQFLRRGDFSQNYTEDWIADRELRRRERSEGAAGLGVAAVWSGGEAGDGRGS